MRCAAGNAKRRPVVYEETEMRGDFFKLAEHDAHILPVFFLNLRIGRIPVRDHVVIIGAEKVISG